MESCSQEDVLAKVPLLGSKNVSINEIYKAGNLEIGAQEQNIKNGVVGQAGIFTSIFNLASSAIGAGVLSFPYAFSQTGLVTGLIISLFMVFLMYFSLNAVLKSVHRTGAYTYEELVKHLLGKKLGVICEIVLLFYLTGACIAYMVIIGDMGSPALQAWFGDQFYTHRAFVISTFSILLILPLCLLRKLSFLAVASILAVLSCLYLAILVIWKGLNEISNVGFENASMTVWTADIFAAMPLVCFAFQCQIIVPEVYSELKDPSLRRMNIVFASSLTLCFLMYAFVGVFGYALFGEEVNGDVLLSFSNDYTPALLGRLCMAFHVTLAYPINSFPCRLAFLSLIFKQKSISNLLFYGITFSMFFFNLIFAILIPEVTIVFTLSGATLGVALIFIFPSLFAWNLGNQESSWIKNLWRIGSVILMTIGVLIAITGTIFTVYNLF